MRVLRWIGKIIVVCICLQWVYAYSYSIIYASYLQERENLLVQEANAIKRNFEGQVEQVGTYVMRKYITRIVNNRYHYNMTKENMENYLKIIMDKEGWRFVQKKVYKKINGDELLFIKYRYTANITFLEENEVRVTLKIDDFYNRLSW